MRMKDGEREEEKEERDVCVCKRERGREKREERLSVMGVWWCDIMILYISWKRADRGKWLQFGASPLAGMRG